MASTIFRVNGNRNTRESWNGDPPKLDSGEEEYLNTIGVRNYRGRVGNIEGMV